MKRVVKKRAIEDVELELQQLRVRLFDKEAVFKIIKDLNPNELQRLEKSSKSMRTMVLKAYPLYWKYWYEKDFGSIEMTDNRKRYLDYISKQPQQEQTYWKRLYEYAFKSKQKRSRDRLFKMYSKIPFPVPNLDFVDIVAEWDKFKIIYNQDRNLITKEITPSRSYNTFESSERVEYDGMYYKSRYGNLLIHIKPKQVIIKIKWLDNKESIVFFNNLQQKEDLTTFKILIPSNGHIFLYHPRYPIKRIVFENDEFVVRNPVIPLSGFSATNISLFFPYLIFSRTRKPMQFYVYSFVKDKILVGYKKGVGLKNYPIVISNDILYLISKKKYPPELTQYSLTQNEVIDKRPLKSTVNKNLITLPKKSAIFNNRYILFVSKVKSRYLEYVYTIDLAENVLYELVPVFGRIEFLQSGEFFFMDDYIFPTKDILKDPIRAPLLVSCKVCSKGSTFLCGSCKNISYCSKKCQKQDWLNHKNKCK